MNFDFLARRCEEDWKVGQWDGWNYHNHEPIGLAITCQYCGKTGGKKCSDVRESLEYIEGQRWQWMELR